MSKRSSRHKRQKKQTPLNLATLIQRGRDAFRQANYDEAIKFWEQAGRKPNAPDKLPAALAEAYFRRALSSPTPRLGDLKQATLLQPTDCCYRYHLALAHQLQGDPSEAETLFRQLLVETPPFNRAAAPLAQLLIDQKKVASKDPMWSHLSADIQTQLAAVEALSREKTAGTLQNLAKKPLEPLWGGLIAFALDDLVTARQKLQAVVDAPDESHTLPQSIAHYYLGVIAVREGQTEAALPHWQTAQNGGLNSPHLSQNLASLAYDQALAAYQSGKPEQAADLLDHLKLKRKYRNDVRAFQQGLYLELGYAAAQKGNWDQAVSYWEQAGRNGDDSRRLIYNLALAYQHQQHHLEAADLWRTLLRRRPRKSTDPDYLTDQQVARIWQNVADNYGMAGDYEEAIKTYKNAVKWAPDNIDLRLKLVETYQTEGRWQAAENELHRILDKNPDHVPALTLLAESYSEGYYPGQARRLWQRILQLEPQNPVARQQLAYSYEREGYSLSMWGQDNAAIKMYQEGLKYVPDSQRLRVMIGGTYVSMGKVKQARKYLEEARAINPNDLQTLYMTFGIWLENYSKRDLRKTLEHIKAVTAPIPGSFFLDLFQYCLNFDREEEGQKLLEVAEERYLDDENIAVGIAVGYLRLEEDNRALAILRGVLDKNATHIEANIQLGILYHRMGQTRLAKRHWQTAEKQARKENNPLLLHQIKLIKDDLLYGKPLPSNPIEMLRTLPPEVREQLLKTAPPEIAALLEDMDPDMLDLLFELGGPGDFDDELFDFDEDDFDDVFF